MAHLIWSCFLWCSICPCCTTCSTHVHAIPRNGARWEVIRFIHSTMIDRWWSQREEVDEAAISKLGMERRRLGRLLVDSSYSGGEKQDWNLIFWLLIYDNLKLVHRRIAGAPNHIFHYFLIHAPLLLLTGWFLMMMMMVVWWYAVCLSITVIVVPIGGVDVAGNALLLNMWGKKANPWIQGNITIIVIQ